MFVIQECLLASGYFGRSMMLFIFENKRKRLNLPSSFIRSLNDQFDLDTAKQLLHVIEAQEPPTSIRINPSRLKHKLNLPAVPWCEAGYYLPVRPTFTKDPLFHAGGYYVQEASSMILEQVIHQARPEHSIRVLDLCAAPGGKSTHLLSLLRNDDLLVANEVIKARAGILHINISKWGADNCFVTNNDPGQFAEMEGFFDLLVVDAPCSGEGMFRKDPDAVAEWSEENVQLCYKRQQRILADAWDCLAYDGVLVYSTCTFNRSENEEVLQWLARSYTIEPIALNLEPAYNYIQYHSGDFSGYKLLPGKVSGEGYCFFAVRKKEGNDRWELAAMKKKRNKGQPPKKLGIEGLIQKSDAQIYNWDGRVVVTRFTSELKELKRNLNVVKSGILVGELKKEKFIPSQELALSDLRDPAYWSEIELTYDEALLYLMKEYFELAAPSRGFHLVTHHKLPLGWINHLRNRFNNLYPSNWRIQKNFRSELPFSIIHYNQKIT